MYFLNDVTQYNNIYKLKEKSFTKYGIIIKVTIYLVV